MRIQDYLRSTAARDRDVVWVGPFLATFTRTDDHPFANYAIPDEGADPTPADIQDLVGAFGHQRRTPRLEFLPGLAPAVEPALVAAGFEVEDRLPLMVFQDRADVVDADGFELIEPSTDAEIFAMVTAQHEAFGDRVLGEDSVPRARRLIDAGGLAVLGRELSTGEPAGGGVCTPIRDGFSEVAGVGVQERFRGRGLGAAMTQWLTGSARDAGAETVFLTPAGDPQERVYARVGYRRIDSMLFLRLP